MKKIISLSLAVIVIALSVLFVAGCSLFTGIKLDTVNTNLKDAGYTVTVLTGDEYVETDDAVLAISAAELNKFLYAVKGEDEIYIFFFTDINTASLNSDFIIINGMLGGQHNEVIYRGTRQAIKDAGI